MDHCLGPECSDDQECYCECDGCARAVERGVREEREEEERAFEDDSEA